jgi:hypothetical protein
MGLVYRYESVHGRCPAYVLFDFGLWFAITIMLGGIATLIMAIVFRGVRSSLGGELEAALAHAQRIAAGDLHRCLVAVNQRLRQQRPAQGLIENEKDFPVPRLRRKPRVGINVPG